MTPEKDTVHNRLRQLIDKLGLNPNSFGVKAGISATAIGNIIKGRENKPSYEVLQKIKDAFPSVNINWLIAGEPNEMFEHGEFISSGTYQTIAIANTSSAETRRVPMISARSTMDNLKSLEIGDPVEVLAHVEIPAEIIGPGLTVAVQYRGTDMQPVVMDGSFVILRRLDRAEWHNFRNEWIHLVLTDTYGPKIKWLKRSTRNSLFWILEAENSSEQPPVTMDTREVQQLWECKAVLQTNLSSYRANVADRIDALEGMVLEISRKVDNLLPKS